MILVNSTSLPYPPILGGGHSKTTTTQVPNQIDRLLTKRHSDITDLPDCNESTIMTTLIHDASPFLFPCTIEYSLIW